MTSQEHGPKAFNRRPLQPHENETSERQGVQDK
jgi:hypothetical protein